MLLRLAASLLLVLGSFGVAAAPSVSAQEADEPATATAEQDADDPAAEETSNLPALLIGAVLLGAGVWAYTNKKKRFPGARFRD